MTGRFRPHIAPRPLDAVLRRMRLLGSLSESEQDLLRHLGERRERHAPGEELIAEGQGSRRARFVVSGWACRQRVLPDGRRQIFGFALPGEAIGVGERPPAPALGATVALTALETVDAEPVVEAALSGRAPGLARALQQSQHFEQALLLDHMVRLGRQTAYERVAHFLLELQTRLQVAGLGDLQRFPLPLTQEIMADVLGLSIVHVNRTLQQLRREKLIELRSGVAILLQRDLLVSISDYRPAVQLRPAAAAARLASA
ncbi:Crp/Fnr family transcriptional regulator [Phenylobacterium sp.]|jgi:CRP-like cAMP-binding protein|uniref:Crp/Fnr family transcriptional regulator n=1 Tax=Phenylobacterium sp. TaxID=1871053 RepID=UPI002F952812